MSVIHKLVEGMNSAFITLAPAFGVAPNISASDGGFCSGSHVGGNASETISWTVNNQSAGFGIKVYRNSVLQATYAISATSHVNGEIGVSGASGHPHSVDWVFRVDIYRISDAVVIQSLSTAHFIDTFGDCTGPA
jgi:hypothetical protein